MKKLFVFNGTSEFASEVFVRLINYDVLKGKSSKSSQSRASKSSLEVKLLKV